MLTRRDKSPTTETSKEDDDGSMRRTPAGDDPASPRGWQVEGADLADEPAKTVTPRRPSKRVWKFILALLVVNLIISAVVGGGDDHQRVPYTLFVEQIDEGNVAEVTSRGEDIQGIFTEPVIVPDGDDEQEVEDFKTERPSFAEDDLLVRLIANDVVVNAKPIDDPTPFWQRLLLGLLPTLLLVGIFVLGFRVLRARGGGGGGGGLLGGFGRSKAKRYEQSSSRTCFDDIAGIDEAEEQLAELVDFLREPEKYSKLGGSIPKGVLLSGLPGTGKTLLARAVAGEADVPFFSMSASEFIEMIVGVGASRVRDLFEQAKQSAPAIVFIDELDAIGRARGGGATMGGHDEREQTLNQILTEMDGFTGSEGVIVLAATNRPEVLDSALLRPGRFDRHVVVSPPDHAGREAILAIHTRNVPLAENADLGAIASMTPGMVGADLRNLMNEAALTAAKRGHDEVEHGDVTDALEKIVLGAERRIVIEDDDRRRTAYHESGHALLGVLQEGADPVRKVSIIPRGQALGVTFQSPDADRYSYTKSYLLGRIVGALGGRAAEEVVFDEVTTGAESDLDHVTGLARHMVGRWGMSPAIGPVAVLPAPGQELPAGAGPIAPSAATIALVDSEIRRIVEECYATALKTLREHRAELDGLAEALLEHETLDEHTVYKIVSDLHRSGSSEVS